MFKENIMTEADKRRAYLENKWRKHSTALRKQMPNITNERLLSTLQLLENTDRELGLVNKRNMFEATQPVDIGPFKRYAFDIITATMPNLIAEDLVSVQSLQQKIGQAFYIEYLFGTSKGSITKGDTLLSPFTNAPGYNETYSSEHVSNELTGISAAAQQGNLSFIPVRPGTVSFNVDGEFVADDGAGHLQGSGTLSSISGTIDYTTGAFDFTLSSPPTGDVSVSYDTDLETAPVNAPEVTLAVREVLMQARPRKLRALYAFDSAYDLKVSQGIDIDESLLMAVSGQLKHETDGEILHDLYAQAGNTSLWDPTFPSTRTGITKKEFNEEFLIEIKTACNKIYQSTRRFSGNWMVGGANVATILESIGEPRFKPSSIVNPVGPYLAGTIDNSLKFYKNPFFGPDEYLIGYKGEMFWEAGYVYAPYLPLFMSNVIMLDDFMGRRGFATSYAKKMLNNKLYVKGKLGTSW